MSSYDEVDLEDMEWNAELGAFTFQCPCGDVFQITPAELRAGEEIAHCPSCSLVVTVVYEDDDLRARARHLAARCRRGCRIVFRAETNAVGASNGPVWNR